MARQKPIESRYTYFVTPEMSVVDRYLEGRPRGFKVGCSATSPREAEAKVWRMLPKGDWLMQLISVTETRSDWGDEDVGD